MTFSASFLNANKTSIKRKRAFATGNILKLQNIFRRLYPSIPDEPTVNSPKQLRVTSSGTIFRQEEEFIYIFDL